MESQYNLQIGKHSYPFDINDEIFTRTGPCLQQFDNLICYSCNNPKTENKCIQSCEFCGYMCCQRCLYKTRKYAE